MIRNLFALTLAAATTGLVLMPLVNANSHQAQAQTPAPAEESMTEEGTEMADIVTIAIEAGQFDTLAAALEAADLVEVLQGEGPFTVFAPTDEAFEALPEGTLEELLLPENKDQLVSILTYHVVPGAVLSTDLESGEVTTVEGSDVTVEVSEGGVTVDGANVISADIEASNGVIHVIDAVILPE
ncbi:MAG: fasciclin domain-containing protein [Synechococcaceae cyanobacterium SM2_3_2]|nr:fasciclin domain-containing protein [Synechococcaceae cyanobacterium SM2_3_2]